LWKEVPARLSSPFYKVLEVVGTPVAVFGNNSYGYLIVDSTRYTLPEGFVL